MGLDANEISGLILITILTGVILTFAVMLAWQSYHCALCNRWLPWRTVREGKFFCDNKGDCNLESLAQKYK
jgi:hypothetical protein